MKAIKIGNRFEIYGDDLQTYDLLPPQTYAVRFANMAGFYLVQHDPLEVSEKVYGVHQQKADKVLKSFGRSERSLGVILSGKKGIGKSIFARLLGEKAVKQNIPVIIVDKYIPGIASYIESIEQEVMILFDEFDKTFAGKGDDDNPSPQTTLLSLFDGVAAGKKLFVITCNETCRLNDYLLNRPGRFHYHFRFECPGEAEIREYLQDKLEKRYWPKIDEVIKFSKRVKLNYDCLRSIAFELSSGASFSESIEDINIVNIESNKYDLALYFDNRTVLTAKNSSIDMFDRNQEADLWLYDKRGYDVLRISFTPSEGMYDPARGCFIIDGSLIKITEYEDTFDGVDTEALKKAKPLYLSITISEDKRLHYMV